MTKSVEQNDVVDGVEGGGEIHRTQTRTTWYLTCVRDNYYARVHTTVGHTDSDSAEHFWLGKPPKFFLVSRIADGIRTRVMESIGCRVRRSTTIEPHPPPPHPPPPTPPFCWYAWMINRTLNTDWPFSIICEKKGTDCMWPALTKESQSRWEDHEITGENIT